MASRRLLPLTLLAAACLTGGCGEKANDPMQGAVPPPPRQNMLKNVPNGGRSLEQLRAQEAKANSEMGEKLRKATGAK